MSVFDRVCRTVGIVLGGSALMWLAALGVVFIAEDCRHMQANFNAAAPWLLIPGFGSFLICVYAIYTALPG